MNPCPNCKQPVTSDAKLCPNCGYLLRPAPDSRFLTPYKWLDTVLGLLSFLLIGSLAWAFTRQPIGTTLFSVSLITNLVLPFILIYTKYRAFAWGFWIGWIICAALILGAIAVCFAMISSGKMNL